MPRRIPARPTTAPPRRHSPSRANCSSSSPGCPVSASRSRAQAKGFFAPASIPPAIAKKLETALARAIRDPEVSAKLKAMAVTPRGNSPDEFRAIIEDDIKAYVEVVKAANLHFEE